MLESPAWREVYAPQGYLLVEGDFVRRTTYGQTLETIAKHGVQAFYEGDIAESAVRTIQESGGILDLEDVSFRLIRERIVTHCS
jgi:gamma-glutamyltranspeptidase/glutathione hydrolase/leukotriene-C4 hydrolase